MWTTSQPPQAFSFSQRVTERKAEKRALAELLESQRQVILAFEVRAENLNVAVTREPGLDRELDSVFALPPDEQQIWYESQLRNLEEARRRETQLRLEGDEFHVWEVASMRECVLKVSELSEISVHHVMPVPPTIALQRDQMLFLQRYAVEDAQQVSDQRVREQRQCIGLWSVDTLTRIKQDDTVQQHLFANAQCDRDSGKVQAGVSFEWKQMRQTRLLVDDREELLEVVGAHLRRYNQARLKLVTELQAMQQLRHSVFDRENTSHKALLYRLWRAVHPTEQLPAVVSKSWTRLGFQSDDPSSDFRSTGLLSLYCLVCFSESHPDEIRELMHVHPEREYPFAASAINVTAMLTNLLGLKKEKVDVPAADAQWDSPLFLFLCRLHSLT
eukprot:c2151_g1_i1.p1 GENE.c2151_g1_i1~~c2151_g1_i1.p1  ORF type:complete len:387 (-),score=102.89 c2151_g1_i1:464-1624(-)